MIRAEGLVKRYRGGVEPVLDGVELTVDRGEILWISGASGSGKTTLLNVLGLLTGFDGGRYSLDGVDVGSMDESLRRRARRETVSTVFQRGNLFGHLTVMENVLLGFFGGTRVEAQRVLDQVGMGARADQLGALLSGGEQARVAFARSAVRATPVLLADEPIANLDRDAARVVLSLVGMAADAGSAVVVVSHDERASTIADRHLSLDGAP